MVFIYIRGNQLIFYSWSLWSDYLQTFSVIIFKREHPQERTEEVRKIGKHRSIVNDIRGNVSTRFHTPKGLLLIWKS